MESSLDVNPNSKEVISPAISKLKFPSRTFEPIIPRTIDELERLEPRFLIPCHCSGLKAVNQIVRNMPKAFIQNSVGTTYVF
jgi:metal-dependent hydrolase (beta-lactamase superfamily II)